MFVCRHSAQSRCVLTSTVFLNIWCARSALSVTELVDGIVCIGQRGQNTANLFRDKTKNTKVKNCMLNYLAVWTKKNEKITYRCNQWTDEGTSSEVIEQPIPASSEYINRSGNVANAQNHANNNFDFQEYWGRSNGRYANQQYQQYQGDHKCGSSGRIVLWHMDASNVACQ